MQRPEALRRDLVVKLAALHVFFQGDEKRRSAAVRSSIMQTHSDRSRSMLIAIQISSSGGMRLSESAHPRDVRIEESTLRLPERPCLSWSNKSWDR